MKESMQREAARQFVADWTDHGYEKGETQKFWLELLGKVLGVSDPYRFIEFEERVMVDTTSFMDAYIPSTRVLIEQKSSRKDLREATRQSDGSMLTPFQQARKYISGLPYSRYPRWVVTCNFRSMLIYDMENPHSEPYELMLDRLEEEYYRLSFLVDDGSDHLRHEEEISLQAGEIVGRIYDLLLTRYLDPDNAESLRSLNVLCTRLVFCLYAEDAGIFGRRGMFYDYLSRFKAGEGDMRRALIELFDVLNTPVEERDPYLRDDLAAFPYVNGGLFEDDHIEIPRFTPEIADLLLNRASLDVDWRHISPTIFGAVFESTLNPETRRSGGMHYTSVKNIHKVIDPLFLDDLRGRLTDIKGEPNARRREAKLRAFQDELADLRFFDPACGSGNFLTETYLSLRRLENEVIRSLYGGQALLGGDFSPIKVSINQMYGIEINDFAVTVAATALWIAEAQMIIETESIVQADLDFLPLKSYSHIVEANALRIDWETVVPKDQLNYIMGNPPFVGARMKSAAQADDMMAVFGTRWRNAGNLDYVCSWYKKAFDYIKGTSIRCAFVSTNSVSQGEQVAILWKPLFNDGLHFDFAHRTFRWDSESSMQAHVHCVIIGFSTAPNKNPKLLFDGEQTLKCENINGYLIDAPSVFVESRNRPICKVPEMVFGSMPNDGGHLSNYSDEKKNAILSKYPEAEPLFRKLLGADEFINNRSRWCLWLKGISPGVIKSIPPVFEAVQTVRETRLSSNRESTRRLADIPYLFGEIRHPDTNYMLVPSTSSERRRYVPLGFCDPFTISSNANLIIPDATLYHFGILTSGVHMAWMRVVCGRLKSDYRYSANIVYNNFPWPTPTPDQQTRIEQTAQAILDARALYPDSSLADLYDEVTMPIELRRAHQANDHAVLDAYTLHHATPESDIVAHLLRLYQQLTT